MNATYNLGKFGTMETTRNRRNNLIYGFVSKEKEVYIFKGKDILEFEENMVNTLRENSELELALRIEENGLEKTSKYYQSEVQI